MCVSGDVSGGGSVGGLTWNSLRPRSGPKRAGPTVISSSSRSGSRILTSLGSRRELSAELCTCMNEWREGKGGREGGREGMSGERGREGGRGTCKLATHTHTCIYMYSFFTQTDTQIDKHTHRYRHTDRETRTDRQIDRRIDGDRVTDEETERHIQTDRHTNRQTYTQI